ncbi:MAG: DMT family transporter, partial [Phycisphaerales bacterium]
LGESARLPGDHPAFARQQSLGIVSIMGADLNGETYALLAALTWAFGLVLFKISGERVPPLALNLFKSTIALSLLLLTLLVFGEGLDTLDEYAPEDLALLLVSGLVGIALADTIFLRALNLIGVGLISITDCLYSPFVILCSILILSERLILSQYIGTGMIMFAVFVSSTHAPPGDKTRGQLVMGMLMAGLSVGMMAFGIVIAKPCLELYDFPLIWATTLRLVAGTLVLALLALASPLRKQYWSVFKPAPVWKVSIPASVLGMYVAMILWVAGFKYTQAAIAGILNQTSTVFAVILATLILKERFTTRKLMAVILAIAGVALVALEPF